MSGKFVISLDFELFWGVRDTKTIAGYGKNILGVRQAVPRILSLFKKFEIKATWATVGLLLFENKKDLLNHIPTELPSYHRQEYSPYQYVNVIGNDEKSDPYHFGFSLARQILATPGQEIGSHTFSHYYCLEAGQTLSQFRADLSASKNIIKTICGHEPSSLVFPRNQFNKDYLSACHDLGFTAFRGNEESWVYRESSKENQTLVRRGVRLMDTYLDLTGSHASLPSPVEGLLNVPASRFLRPYSTRLGAMENLRLHRICKSMTDAAVSGRTFHLWWHPHNFGSQLEKNLSALETILKHYVNLREKYAMSSESMESLAEQKLKVVA